MTELVPLRRNRDFVLSSRGSFSRSSGSRISGIAYPLLTLALTGSAAKTGYVGAAEFAPLVLLSAPAGVAADRFDRRRLMIASDVVGAVGARRARSGRADAPRRVLDDPRRRVRRYARPRCSSRRRRAARSRRSSRSRSSPTRRACRWPRCRSSASARPPLGGALFGLGARLAVPRRRRLLRLLDGVAPADADAVPGEARSRRADALPRGRRVLLEHPVPPGDDRDDRGEQPRRVGRADRGDHPRPPPTASSSTEIGGVRRAPGSRAPRRLAALAAAAADLPDARDPAVGVLDGARLRRVPRLPERLRARGRARRCTRSGSRTPTRR